VAAILADNPATDGLNLEVMTMNPCPFAIESMNGPAGTTIYIVPSQMQSGESGFGVIIYDTEAEHAVDGIRVYRSIKGARHYAEQCANA